MYCPKMFRLKITMRNECIASKCVCANSRNTHIPIYIIENYHTYYITRFRDRIQNNIEYFNYQHDF